MRTVLSAFTDRAVANQAADDLDRAGLARGRIQVRIQGQAEDPSLGHPVDELVTGGAVTDFFWLLDRLFGNPSPARPAATGVDVVREGGAVVVVHAADDDEAARVQEFLLEAGAAKQAHLPRAGDLD